MIGRDDLTAAEIELLKAVAQAWHGQADNPGPTGEFHVATAAKKKGGAVGPRPSRFMIEAAEECKRRWDFRQSLWDSYEIVTLSKRLESGLVVEDQTAMERGAPAVRRTKRESKRSLRNLLRVRPRSSRDDFALLREELSGLDQAYPLSKSSSLSLSLA